MIARPSPRPRRGFTLLEVLITATVVIVLAAAAMPAMTLLMSRQEAMTLRADVVGFLASQRQQAVDSGNVRAVRWEAGGHHLIAYVDGQPVDAELALPDEAEIVAAETERLPDRVAEPLESSLVDASWSTEVLFYPDGCSTDATLEITLGSREIVVRLDRWSGLAQ